MLGKRGIIIAGMHGKTTTSAMTAHVLRGGGLHPSHYVGAEIPILGSNAHWDPRGEYFVAEGDESDGTLQLFQPEHALILNIEEEHLDFYKDLAAIEEVFAKLLAPDQRHGFLLRRRSARHAHLRSARHGRFPMDSAKRRAIARPGSSCGFRRRSFALQRGDEKLGDATLSVPGKHNVSNALGVIALATELGIPFEKIAKSLGTFRHARRRFEIKYRERSLSAGGRLRASSRPRFARRSRPRESAGRKRVLTMFQPHRYSRTKALRQSLAAPLTMPIMSS